MRILLFRTWLTNIGNGFIDVGAKVCLQKAFPDAQIIEASCFPNYIASQTGLLKLLAHVIKNERIARFGVKQISDVLNIAELLKRVDLAVIAGAILTPVWISGLRNLLIKLLKRGIPLVFLGAGGSYEFNEISLVKEMINEIRPKIMFARDYETYKTS